MTWLQKCSHFWELSNQININEINYHARLINLRFMNFKISFEISKV